MSRSPQRRGPGALPVIKVSELGDFSYCNRAWWYRHVVKLAPPSGAGSDRLAAGEEAHRRYGRGVLAGVRLNELGLLLLLGALLALGVAALLALTG